MTAFLSKKVYKEGNVSDRSFIDQKNIEKNELQVKNSIFLDHFYNPMEGKQYDEKLKSLLNHKED